jgi:hypothetical protein
MPAPRQHWRGYQIIFKKNIKDFFKKTKKNKKNWRGGLATSKASFGGPKMGVAETTPIWLGVACPPQGLKWKKRRRGFGPSHPQAKWGWFRPPPKLALATPLAKMGVTCGPKGWLNFLFYFLKNS